ncbi:MAG: hypothetical protein JW934_17300 [Anaerolineae bacterium]|nr:hypothetical protein [Anaerolineae bacterium]
MTLLCLFIVILPLAAGPGPVNTRGGGDSPFLYVRLEQLVEGLKAGQFPVRWMPDAAYGLGYPFFNFYAALPYYIAALFRLLGWGPILSIQVTQALGFVLAAASMGLLARRAFRHPAPRVLAVVAYTVAPFHLVNVYVRGDSLSEFYAFVFFPLIFWALLRLRDDPTWRNVGLLGLSYGGLILTHNLSAIMFSPFVAALALWGALSTEVQRRVPALLKMLAGGLFGLALSASLWLVAVVDLPAVRMSAQDIQTSGYFNPEGHLRGLDLVQLSLFFDYDVVPGTTPFAMGAVQAALLVLATGVVVWGWFRKTETGFLSKTRFLNSFWIAGLLLSTFLITTLSKPLWQHLPVLPIVQFPWRFLSIQALFGALVLGEAVNRLPKPWWSSITAALLLAAAAVGALRPEYIPIGESDINDESLALFELFSTNVGTTIRGEYLPADVEPRPYTSAAFLNRGTRPPQALSGQLAHAELVERSADVQRWQIEVTSEYAEILFYIYNFPGWQARVDGRPTSIWSAPNSGLISLAVPQGAHQIELRFGRTTARWLADALSLIGAAACLLVLRPWAALRRVRWQYVQIGAVALFFLYAGVTALSALAAMRRPVAAFTSSFDFDRLPLLHPNPAGIDFGAVRLSQYEYNADVVSGGDTLTVQLDWAQTDPGRRARIALVSPALDVYPSFAPVPAPLAFAEAAIVDETMALPLTIPADAASGMYYVILRVFNASEEIKAITPQGRTLGTTYLRPLWIDNSNPAGGPRPALLDQPVRAWFGDEIVLRDDVQVQVADGFWDIRLTWQALRPLSKNYTLSLRMLAADGAPIPGAHRDLEGGPSYGFMPTTAWTPGEWLTDRVRMAVPEGVNAGDATALVVVLYDRAQPDFPALGSVVIPLIERAHQFTVPSMQHPVDTLFGERVGLLGYDLEQTPEQLKLTLYWQAAQQMDIDYTVFVHLFDPATEIIARQADARPLNGLYPTNGWLPGEVVDDIIVLSLHDVPAGRYALAVGLYDARDWTRLPIIDAQGRTWPDGRLVLQHVFVQ